jgi:hypothetical protein
LFLGSERGYDANICGFGSSGNVIDGNGKHGLGACGHAGAMSLPEASNFIGAGGIPERAFAAVAEFLSGLNALRRRAW